MGFWNLIIEIFVCKLLNWLPHWLFIQLGLNLKLFSYSTEFISKEFAKIDIIFLRRKHWWEATKALLEQTL